uniref:Methyltransferase type 11 n=1 Tax=Cyanothece sp. (strain PCC 7425 / ATCC 29141) TaxID=395961 RepID=B8HPE8_CYAP4
MRTSEQKHSPFKFAGITDVYRKFFAWAMARGGADYEQAIAPRKHALFGQLQGEVLEIGPGAGVNLAYTSPQAHWIGIEPNPHMHPYLRAEAEKYGVSIDLRTGSATDLEVEDNSRDAVISTLVLCSVPDPTLALAEIYRVLKPGGKFLFIEHVAAPEGTRLRRLQQFVRPVWQMIGDGCCPDRDTGLTIRQAGFSQVNYESFTGPVPIAIVQPHIAGVAIK